ncbi:MAG: glycosyltransferase family 39 protein [Candidatus Alcyoniella australis]|nr:glycosyltransferase family 39 protein [Candidatus Alcyoniella australis]
MSNVSRSRLYAALVLAALIVAAVLSLQIGAHNQLRAAGNNELENIELSLELTRAASQGRWSDVLGRYTGTGQARFLPLTADAFFGIGWLISGESFLSIRRLNALALALMLLSCYLLAATRLSRPYALLACLLLACIPLVNVTARFVNPKPLAAAAVTLALWALMRSDDLRNARWSALAGALCGLALLSERGLPPILLGFPLALFAIRGLVWRGTRARALAGIALFGGCALLIAGPNLSNYLAGIERVLNQAYFGTPGGDTAHAADPAYYLHAFWNELLTPPQALIYVLLVPLSLLGKRRPWELWLWLIPPFFVLSTFNTKLPYYMFGLLPPLAILAAHGLSNIPWTRPRRALSILAALIAVSSLALSLYTMPRPPWFWPAPGVSPQLAQLCGGCWAQVDYPSRFNGTGERIVDEARRVKAAAVLFDVSNQDERTRAWAAVVGRRLPRKPVLMVLRNDPTPDIGEVGRVLLLVGNAHEPLIQMLGRPPLVNSAAVFDDEIGQALRAEMKKWNVIQELLLRYDAGRTIKVQVLESSGF